VLGSVFSIFGAVIGLAIMLLMFALKALIVGAVVYFVIRIVSPENRTAATGPVFRIPVLARRRPPTREVAA